MPRSRWPSWNGNTFQLIQKLAPFGKGNPLPTFVSRAVQVAGCRSMGADQQHLRLKLKQDGCNFDAVAFKFGDSRDDISEALDLDIVYNLELDRWNGGDNLRLNILSFSSNPSVGK